MKVRKAIALLQVFPLITSIVFIADILADAAGLYITQWLEPLFGVSLFPVGIMYCAARNLKVQRWSRVLYFALLCVPVVAAADSVFGFNLSAELFNRTVFTILSAGCISSFLTFIYTKYKTQ